MKVVVEKLQERIGQVSEEVVSVLEEWRVVRNAKLKC